MTGYVIWPIMFGGFGLLFTAIELLRPARPLSYRAALKNDLPALAILFDATCARPLAERLEGSRCEAAKEGATEA